MPIGITGWEKVKEQVLWDKMCSVEKMLDISKDVGGEQGTGHVFAVFCNYKKIWCIWAHTCHNRKKIRNSKKLSWYFHKNVKSTNV